MRTDDNPNHMVESHLSRSANGACFIAGRVKLQFGKGPTAIVASVQWQLTEEQFVVIAVLIGIEADAGPKSFDTARDIPRRTGMVCEMLQQCGANI